MSSMSVYSPCSNPRYYGVVSLPNRHLFIVTFKSSFFCSKLPGNPISLLNHKTRKFRSEPFIAASTSTHTFDGVIIGAGIIGLTIARQFLIGSNQSVAGVDKAVQCSGATGAGQGFVWMGHKSPERDKWELTMRSHRLWGMLAESIRDQGLNPLEVLGWKRTGSLLLGRTPEQSEVLKRWVKRLSEAGLKTEYLSGHDLHLEEPELEVGEGGGAAFFPDDRQLDAHR